jgi:membrane associated rhomboid family serine protease
MHGSFDHIFFNMFSLWMFGSVLENLWGPKRFLTFYFVCGLGAALCHMLVLFFENQSLIAAYNSIDADSFQSVRNFISANARGMSGSIPVSLESANFILNTNLNEATLGASGAVFGCLIAFGYLFPNTTLMIFPIPIPIKAKWFVLLYAGFELYSAVRNSAGDNVAHVAHLGGALFGFLLVYFWNKNNRRTFY